MVIVGRVESLVKCACMRLYALACACMRLLARVGAQTSSATQTDREGEVEAQTRERERERERLMGMYGSREWMRRRRARSSRRWKLS